MGAPKDPKKRKFWIENLSKAHTGKKYTQESKDKMSIATSGENNGMYGKKQTQKMKDSISGENNYNYGKHNDNHKPDCSCSFCKAKRGELQITGENHPQYKGKEYQKKNGRWMIWIDGIRYNKARYITMKCIDRELIKGEEVHHINEDPSNDKPKNLYLFATHGKHMSHHMMKNPPILISNIL